MSDHSVSVGYDPTLPSRRRIAASEGLTDEQRRRTEWRVRFGKPAVDGPTARYAVAWADERLVLSTAAATTVLAFILLGLGVLLVIFGATSFGYEGHPAVGGAALVTGPLFVVMAALLPLWRENAERASAVNDALLRDQPLIEPAHLRPWEPPSRAQRSLIWLYRGVYFAWAAVFLVRSIRDDGWTAGLIILALSIPIGAVLWWVSKPQRRARNLARGADQAEREYRQAHPENLDAEA